MITDDTPEVCISGFDPYDARSPAFAERLIQNGRIHPARIEEVVEKVTQNRGKHVRGGRKAAFGLGIPVSAKTPCIT